MYSHSTLRGSKYNNKTRGSVDNQAVHRGAATDYCKLHCASADFRLMFGRGKAARDQQTPVVVGGIDGFGFGEGNG